MKRGLALSIVILSSLALGIMIFTLTEFQNNINLKGILQGKNKLNRVVTLAEGEVMENLQDKLKNIEELVVVSTRDEDASDKEIMYEKSVYYNNKDILNEKPTERDKLIYRVNRRLRPENDLRETLSNFREFDKTQGIVYRANLWGLAEEVVTWSGIFDGDTREENTNEYLIGDKSKDYHQEYPIEDYLEKSNLTDLGGKLSIDGDFDKSINSYVTDIVQIKDNKIKLYKFSMLEDKFELEKNIEIESPSWEDEMPIVTSVFNNTTNLLETYIGVYSPSRKLLNLYVYSLIEDKITLVGNEWDLSSKVPSENVGGVLDTLLDVDEEYVSDRIKDVKISAEFNESINLPQIVIGVHSKFIGKTTDFSEETYFTEDIIYNFEYIPIMEDFPTVSTLHIRGNINNWGMCLVWSDSTRTNNLNTVTNEVDTGLNYYTAMVIIDDKYEHSEDNSIFKGITINQDEISSDDLDDLVFTSFNDKITRLTKNILVVKVGSKIYQLNGSMELEEWEEIYLVDKNATGVLDLTSVRGDISSIHLLLKPKAKHYFNTTLPIEIVSENQKTGIKVISRTDYKLKIFNDNSLEYSPTDRKRDYRVWEEGDNM